MKMDWQDDLLLKPGLTSLRMAAINSMAAWSRCLQHLKLPVDRLL